MTRDQTESAGRHLIAMARDWMRHQGRPEEVADYAASVASAIRQLADMERAKRRERVAP